MNQITGLLDLGHEVEIFAGSKSQEGKEHPDIQKYALLDHTHYIFGDIMPVNKIKRVVMAFLIIMTNCCRQPLMMLKSLNVFKYGMSALSLLLFYSSIYLSKQNFDIAHCHYGPNGIFGCFLKDLGVIKVVVTSFYGYDLSLYIKEKGNDAYDALFAGGDLFLPLCEYYREKLISLKCDEKKIVVHRMGIDLGTYRYVERAVSGNTPITLLTLARLSEKKGHEYAIMAIEKVRRKHKNILYIVAGDGELREELESLAIGLGIADHVVFCGAVMQDEALDIYRKAHIFILPSVTANNGDQEGTPIVLMEAQALGLPTVSTYHSGIPEIVSDGSSGFLVPERDVTALAEKLEYLIEHQNIWPEMGKNGRRIIEDIYDINKSNKRLVEMYQHLNSALM